MVSFSKNTVPNGSECAKSRRRGVGYHEERTLSRGAGVGPRAEVISSMTPVRFRVMIPVQIGFRSGAIVGYDGTQDRLVSPP
jgi:hypothetical protein